MSERLPRRALRLGSFLHAGTGENAGEAVVPFVARVLVERTGRPGHRQLTTPAAYEGLGIVDRELVKERVGVDPCVALNQVQVVGRAAEIRLVGEVGDVDHERVALPAAA